MHKSQRIRYLAFEFSTSISQTHNKEPWVSFSTLQFELVSNLFYISRVIFTWKIPNRLLIHKTQTLIWKSVYIYFLELLIIFRTKTSLIFWTTQIDTVYSSFLKLCTPNFFKQGTSRCYTDLSGVCQGSQIGPLLFTIYINDNMSFIKLATCFADDMKLYSNSICLPLDVDKLQEDINNLANH